MHIKAFFVLFLGLTSMLQLYYNHADLFIMVLIRTSTLSSLKERIKNFIARTCIGQLHSSHHLTLLAVHSVFRVSLALPSR